MSDETSTKSQGFDRKLVLGFSLGLTTGLIIGVGISMLGMRSARADDATPTVAATAAPLPERWLIWSGSAPVVGDAFKSETECETGRRKLLDAASMAYEEARKQLPPITFRQIQALGYNPADRVEGEYKTYVQAYCRRSGE